MSNEGKHARNRFSRVVFAFFLAGVAFGAGWAMQTECPAQADVRKSATGNRFQGSGQMSVTVLREIAATLKSIDDRLEKIERVVVRDGDAGDTRTPRPTTTRHQR